MGFALLWQALSFRSLIVNFKKSVLAEVSVKSYFSLTFDVRIVVLNSVNKSLALALDLSLTLGQQSGFKHLRPVHFVSKKAE